MFMAHGLDIRETDPQECAQLADLECGVRAARGGLGTYRQRRALYSAIGSTLDLHRQEEYLVLMRVDA